MKDGALQSGRAILVLWWQRSTILWSYRPVPRLLNGGVDARLVTVDAFAHVLWHNFKLSEAVKASYMVADFFVLQFVM